MQRECGHAVSIRSRPACHSCQREGVVPSSSHPQQDRHPFSCWHTFRRVRAAAPRRTGVHLFPSALLLPVSSLLSDAVAQAETVKTARKYAAAMKAPLVFTSASLGVNIQKLFKARFPTLAHPFPAPPSRPQPQVALSKTFNLKCAVQPIQNAGEPLLEY